MGCLAFIVEGEGKNAEAVFRLLQQHQGVHDKTDFVLREAPVQDMHLLKTQLRWELIDATPLDSGRTGLTPWGPCKCYHLKGDRFVFFGRVGFPNNTFKWPWQK